MTQTKTLKRKADRLFSQIIRARGRCQRCDKKPPEVVLHCAHIYSRRYTAIRWDERNSLCLCASCHFWSHQHPVEWSLFIEDLFGVEQLRSLLEEARAYPGRIKRVDYEGLIADLKKRVA